MNSSNNTYENTIVIHTTNNFTIPEIAKHNTSISTKIYIDNKGNLLKSNFDSLLNDKKIKQKVVKRTVQKVVQLFNQDFNLEIENGNIILTHDKWSLVGTGNDLFTAEIDLLNNAKLMSEAYLNIPLYELTEEAMAFRNFLITIV